MTEPPLDGLVPLAERLQGLCLGAGLTVATAESCTGGLVAAALTEVPGSSGYVRGGVVAYADEVKAALLGVPNRLIEAHGAVSAQVARSMAEGIRDRLAVDLAAAVTGVAGPGGATPAKPVGLTYVAVAAPDGTRVDRHLWHGDRASNRAASARAALASLIEAAERAAAERAAADPPASTPG